MNRSRLTAAAVLAAALSATSAFAAPSSGPFVPAGELVGVDALQARSRLGTPATRAEVLASLRAAQHDGTLAAAGDAALATNPLASKDAATSAKTRDQVRAEYREAIRNGEVAVNGEFGRKVNELTPQRYAKQG